MTVHLLKISNDNTVYVKLQDLPADPTADEFSGDAITDASPTVTVQSATGATISGGSFPVSMVHSSGGWYSGVAPAATSLVHETAYKVVVVAGSTLLIEGPAVAWNRTLTPPTQTQMRVIARAAGLVP